GPPGNAEGGKALDGGSDALHLGERAEWYRVHVVQDDPLHASERSLAIVRVRQPVHVVPRGQQIWVALVVFRAIDRVRIGEELHGREGTQRGRRAPAGEEEVPTAVGVPRHPHRRRPIDDVHLRVDAHRLHLLLHHQGGIVHWRGILVG